MIEIVFSDSACGSLKMAQSFGQGKYQGGCIGVSLIHDDGRMPSKKEIKAARNQAMEKARLAWEGATPMGGKASDIYGFNLALSVGDISENQPGPKRKNALEGLYSVYPNGEGRQAAKEILKRANENLKSIRERLSAGEAIRIWYSNQADDMCGMYWFMDQIKQWEEHNGQVLLVKLPEWEIDKKGSLVWKNSWSEVAPEEWSSYISLQKTANPVFILSCAFRWKELQAESAPLRAVLNGHLLSMSEKLYDEFIVNEIEAEAEEFQEAMIIGRVLGKYRLGIGDGWIAYRIEEMIHDGKLEVVTAGGKDMPIYHRVLKKCSNK